MTNFKKIFYFEWLKFKNDKTALAAILLTLVCGLYSIYYGVSEIKQQEVNIQKLQVMKDKTIEEMKEKFPDNNLAAEMPYYLYLPAVNIPDPLASLSIGQRDINPYYIKLRLLALESQLYDSDNINPMKASVGNFDFSFILIFLFPLIIIALSFNVLSYEKENGILPMILSNPVKLLTFIATKLFFRFTLMLTTGWMLLIIGYAASGAAFDSRFFIWVMIICLYISFWFALSFFVVSFKKSSSFNSTALLASWLWLMVIIPAGLNAVMNFQFQSESGVNFTINQREAVHSGWDKSMEESLIPFFVKYPQYKDFKPASRDFSYGWYYAFQELGDMSVEKEVKEHTDSQKGKAQFTRTFDFLSPGVNVQNMVNALAATDLSTHLEFLDSARDFHKRMKEFFFPYVFTEAGFPHGDYKKLPTQSFQGQADLSHLGSGIFKLLLSSIVLLGLGIMILRRKPN